MVGMGGTSLLWVLPSLGGHPMLYKKKDQEQVSKQPSSTFSGQRLPSPPTTPLSGWSSCSGFSWWWTPTCMPHKRLSSPGSLGHGVCDSNSRSTEAMPLLYSSLLHYLISNPRQQLNESMFFCLTDSHLSCNGCFLTVFMFVCAPKFWMYY